MLALCLQLGVSVPLKVMLRLRADTWRISADTAPVDRRTACTDCHTFDWRCCSLGGTSPWRNGCNTKSFLAGIANQVCSPCML